MAHVFRAEWDKTVKVITTFIVILLISIALSITYKALISGKEFTLAFNFLILGILLLTYLYAPKCYEITERGVVIVRRIGSIQIPFSAIRRFYGADLGRVGLRLWGCGGLFGYFGLYSIRGMGRVWVYATKKEVVVIETDSKKYAISPENIFEFLETLKSKLQ